MMRNIAFEVELDVGARTTDSEMRYRRESRPAGKHTARGEQLFVKGAVPLLVE